MRFCAPQMNFGLWVLCTYIALSLGCVSCCGTSRSFNCNFTSPRIVDCFAIIQICIWKTNSRWSRLDVSSIGLTFSHVYELGVCLCYKGYSRRIQDSNLSSCWMATEEGDGDPADPDVEMDVIEPLDSSHMRKYLNLVSTDLWHIANLLAAVIASP